MELETLQLRETASSALAEARRHKRLAAHHRRRARERMQLVERIRRELEARGVRLILTTGEAPEVRHGRDEAEETP